MYENEKRIIDESFQLFLIGALKTIECDDIQAGLFEALEDFKYKRGPGFIRIKDTYQLDDPCVWLLSKVYHPDEILKDPDPDERLMLARIYEVAILLPRDGWAIHSVYNILKPFMPNALKISLINQWVALPKEKYIEISEVKPGEIIQLVEYKDNIVSVVEV